MLTEADRRRVAEELGALPSPVRLVFFTQTFGCDTCDDTKRMLEEVVSLSPQLTLVEHNLVLDKEAAERYGVDRAPAVVLEGEQDTGIRFYGAPIGYEFVSLLTAIKLVSARDSGLTAESRALVAGVHEPVNIQVFSTPG